MKRTTTLAAAALVALTSAASAMTLDTNHTTNLINRFLPEVNVNTLTDAQIAQMLSIIVDDNDMTMVETQNQLRSYYKSIGN